MAANEIVFKVKVDKDGSLDIVAKQATSAAKSTEKLGKSTDSLNKKRGQYQKVEKGVGQAGLSTGKAFSKQAGAISGGLVPAYAVLAANIFAITAAFGALKNAAQVEVLEEGFTTLGNTVGRTSTLMAQRLKDVTGGAVSTEQALRTASAGFSAGFSISEMEGLAQVARGASVALGRDLGDALDRLIRGTAKLEPEILDELGIFIKIEDAAAKYAAAIGKVPGALTDVERRQAFLNEALEQGKQKFQDVADVDINPFDKISATFQEMAESFLQIINIAVVPFINFLSQNVTALLGVMILFGTSVAKLMIPALGNLGQGTIDAAKAAKEAIPTLRAATKAAIEAEQAAIGSAKVKIGKNSIFAQLQGKVASGKASPEDIKKSINSITQSIMQRERIAKQAGATVSAEYLKETEALRVLKARYVELNALRTGSAADQSRAAFLSSMGDAETALGESMQKINEAGSIGGFKVAIEGMKKYRDSVMSANREGGRFRSTNSFVRWGRQALAGFTVAGGGARLFGAALINAIPLIGQLIFAAGLLIQAFQFLFSKAKDLAGPLSELDTIMESMPEKFEQLADKIQLSVDKLDELGSQSLKNAQRGRHLEAQYVVLNGVVGESADAFKRFSNAMVAADISIFDRFIAAFAALGGGITDAAVKGFSLLGDKIVEISNAAVSLTENVPFFDFLKKAKDKVVELATGIAKPFEKVGKNIGESMDRSGARAKLSGITNKFEELVETMIDADSTKLVAGIFGDAMTGKIDGNTKSMASFIAEIEAAYAADGDLEAAQKKLDNAFDRAKGKTVKLEAATKGLGKQLVEAGQKSSAFFAALTSKDKFVEFKNTMVVLQKSVNDSIKTLEGMGTAGKSLQATFDDKNAIFKQFGITLADLKENKGKVFDPIIKGAQRVTDAVNNTKNMTKQLKEGLKQLKIDDKLTKTNRTLKNMQATFIKTGKFEVSLADQFKNIEADRKSADALAQAEYTLKVLIIGLEEELLIAKIDFMLMNKNLEEDQRTNLKAQRGIIQSMSGMQLQTAEKQYNLALATNKLTQTTTTGSTTAAALGATQTGSTADRITGFAALVGRKPSKDKLTKGTDSPEVFAGKQAAADIQDMRTRLDGLKGVLGPTMDALKELGPEGELVATVTAGSFAISDSFLNVAQTFAASTDKMERGAAIASAVAQTISQVAQIMSAASAARVAGIDKEIAAEQKRDGKSKESLSKITALEKKKDAMKRKAFETNKKLMMAQVIASTAAAMMGVAASLALIPYGAGLPFIPAAMIAMGALGATQLAIIAGTSYQGGGSIGSASGGPSEISVGKRKEGTDVAKSKSAGGELAYFRGERGTGGPENFQRAFYGKKHRAAGGSTGYVVGEQGPELFMPDRPGTIVPSDDLAQMGGGSNVTFNISTVDATGVEDLLVEQQGNIIGMLRQAANSYGQGFLEDIDETTYTSPQARRA